MLTRKNIILIATAGITVIIFSLILFLVKGDRVPKHCFNEIKDIDEQGIDCGGACPKSCEILEELEILWTKIISVEQDNHHLLALIKNPNALYGVSSFSYQFSGLNNKNEIVFERQGEDFILPSEDRYLFELNVDDLKGAEKLDLKIYDLIWQRFFSYKKPTLLVINKEIKDINEGGFSLEVSGRLINDSIYNLRTVGLRIVLFDKDNNPIAFNRTYLGNIRSREKRDFRVFWKPPLSRQVVERVDVRPETNVFKEDNFLKDYNYEKVDVRYESEK